MTPEEQAAYDRGFKWGERNARGYGEPKPDYTNKDEPPYPAPTGRTWVWTWMGTRSDPVNVYEWRLSRAVYQ